MRLDENARPSLLATSTLTLEAEPMPKRKRRGNIERRGRSTRVRIMVGRKRYSFTIETTDRALVKAFVKQKRAALERRFARHTAGLDGSMPFSELLDAFDEEDVPTLAPGAQAAYRDSLAPIREYFVGDLGNPSVDAIMAREIIGYMTWRRSHRRNGSEAVSARTVAKDRAVLHRIFAKAVRQEFRDGNPVSRTKAPKADTFNPVILTSDEYDRLVAACARRPMLQLYMLVLGEAGLRANTEALMLQWEDVDLEGGFLRVTSGRDGHRTKSGKTRWVPMTARLKTAMRDHFARYHFATYRGRRTPWVFHHDHDHHKCKAGARIQSLIHGFKSAARRAKLNRSLRQHDLRHRRVTVWLADGASPALVKEAMGHSDLRTTMGYSHLSREHLRALVESASYDQKPGANSGPIQPQGRATGER